MKFVEYDNMKRKKVKDVTGSDDFSPLFESLPEDNPFKIEIRNAIKILYENCTKGEKIEHGKWPEYYIKKYKINNLWRYELLDGKRMVYTLLGTPDGIIVSIIEAFPNHKEYDKRFGY